MISTPTLGPSIHKALSTNKKDATPLQCPTELCRACQQISLAKLSKGQKLCPKSLESASCPLCQLLYECCCQTPSVPYNWRPRRLFGCLPEDRTELSKRTRSEYILVSMRKGGWHGSGRCFGSPDQGLYALQFLERDRVGAPGSHDTFTTIRKWIDTCVNTHPACKKSISGDAIPLITRLPTRVIDVGPSDGSESPYLLETKGLDGKYIALSHCWGGRACTMTTTASLDSHRQGIGIDILSKTHKEAIVATRELGLRYIWIDSLCIVQDDPEDWFREAHLMGSVFENAFCTIAATGAKDGSIGLFIDNGRKRIRLLCEPGRPELGHMYFGRRSPNSAESVDSAPLQRRGWVLQERILSRRLIHFAEDQVYWECDEAFRYEDEPPNMLPFRRSAISRNRAKISNVIQARRNYYDLQGTWSYILKAYLRCSLTRTSDKLVAIDGLAKRIQEATDFRYYNGIWFDNLPTKDAWYGLTWFAGEKCLVRLAQVRAPSWSWAAMDGEFFGITILFAT